jgi:hypothetical protein
MRSSAMPELIYFDSECKQGVIILKGKPVEAPTVIYVPRVVQYTNGCEVAATSSVLKWNEADQLLFWKPDPALPRNQIILYPPGRFDNSKLPKASKELLKLTTKRLHCTP